MRTLFLIGSLMGYGTAAMGQATPIVIGHRGAPRHLPDHTLASYERAIRGGADFLEPDLVSTKDGVLIARHENEMGGTTDVGERFPDRRTTRIVDGRTVEGWFSEDFTLAEVKTLRAKQPLPGRSHEHDGQYPVPTLDEILALAVRLQHEMGRPVGVYPETKHPSYFDALGLSLEEPLLAALTTHGYTSAVDPVFIQSFEIGNLEELAERTSIRLVQLIGDPAERPFERHPSTRPTYAEMLTPDGLASIHKYAAGIGVHKSHVLFVPDDGSDPVPTGLVQQAHAAALAVHVYTFRPDASFLPARYADDAAGEIAAYLGLGIDGVFADDPEQAVRVRDSLLRPVTDAPQPR